MRIYMIEKLHAFGRAEGGATAIEYGLIAVILTSALVTTLGGMKDDLSDTFTEVGKGMAKGRTP